MLRDSDLRDSTSWIDTINIPINTKHITSTLYFDQHSTFLGETFVIENTTFFKDSSGNIHILPQQLI